MMDFLPFKICIILCQEISLLNMCNMIWRNSFNHLDLNFLFWSWTTVKNMREGPFHEEIYNEQLGIAPSEGNLDRWGELQEN